MSNPETADSLPSVRKGPAFPRKMGLLTGVAISLSTLAFAFNSKLEDMFSVGLDVIMVFSIFGFAALLLLWVGWFLFFSRWKWWARICASAITIFLPIAFMVIFRPVNGGDAT